MESTTHTIIKNFEDEKLCQVTERSNVCHDRLTCESPVLDNFEKNGASISPHRNTYGSIKLGCAVKDGTTSQVRDQDVKANTFKFREMSGRKKWLLLICILSHFMSGLSISLLAPFYPQEAQRKGMSLTLIGVTFSLLPLTMFILSPIFGTFLIKVGPKFMLVSGIIVGGICNILYGTLNKSPPGTPFIVASLMCRLVEGIGFCAYCLAIYTILANEFPGRATTVISFIQTASEIGLMVGPAVGGILYELGGFGTPFYTSGAVIVINGFVLYKAIPNSEFTTNNKKRSICLFLRNSLVIAGTASLIITIIGVGFLEASLANHLAPLKISSVVIGLLFTIVPGLFALTSPFYSYLIDTKGLHYHFAVIGQIVSALGFFFIGPGLMFPFLHLNYWTVIIGLILFGGTWGCCVLPVIKFVFEGLQESGMEQNAETHALASTFLSSMYSLGAFIGPVIGNALIEEMGDQFGYTVIGALNVFVSVMCLVIFLTRRYTKSNVLKK